MTFSDWLLFLGIKKLENLVREFSLNEAATRYSVEVNFRTNLAEITDHFVKLCLGYIMAALKKHDYHVKHVFTTKPYRILISTKQWDDGEWVGIVCYNESHKCFMFVPGVYSKSRQTASFDNGNGKKCIGTSASEITKEILSEMEELKKKPLRDGERLNPIHRKRGPQK